MCGIGGLYVKVPGTGLNCEAYVDALLLGLEERGKDATGLLALGESWRGTIEKGACNAWEFTRNRTALPKDPRVILCHTRFATQGEAKDEQNNHPVSYGDVYVIHNGHIWNDLETFQALGLPRYAAVDSEAIPAALSCAWDEKYQTALELLEGDLAIAAIHLERPGELLLARGAASPLYVHETPRFLAWASTAEALRNAWTAGIGSAPRKAPRYTPEGTILRVCSEGITTRERFRPADDWRLPYVAPKKSARGVPLARWAGPKKTSPDFVPQSVCESCGNETPRWDLYRYEGLMLCPSCEDFFEGNAPLGERAVCEYCGCYGSDGVWSANQWICNPCVDAFLVA